jgi:hypothetical protein
MSLGFMTVAELATCRVPEDLTSPVPVEGYVVTFVAFYERGFEVPSYRFLRSLMQYYGLHLQCIPPLGILYTMAFCDSLQGLHGD